MKPRDIYRVKYLLVILLVALFSCKKELDFRYHDVEPRIVVEAVVDTLSTRVSITRATPMGEPMDRERLTDATVTLIDVTSGQEIFLTPDSEGVFVGAGGVIGNDYCIVIRRKEMDFFADAHMPQPAEITDLSFEWIKMPYDYVAALRLSFMESPLRDTRYFWIRIYRNEEIYSWSTLMANPSSDGSQQYVTLTTRRDIDAEDEGDLLLAGDVVTATVTPLSESQYDWVNAISSDASGAPQFSDKSVLGYFIAAPTSSRSVIFER